MATPKTKPKKRRRKALSAPTKRRRRKSGLSEMFNATTAMHSAKTTLAAGGGGLLAMVVNKSVLPPTSSKVVRIGTALVGGFLASAFGMASVGAGFTGGLMALSFPNGLLADDDMQETDFADDNVLSDQPIFLDDEGNPMYLNDGNGAEPYYQYLSEEEIAEYEMQEED